MAMKNSMSTTESESNNNQLSLVPIKSRIHVVRGTQVMIDLDLASLYGVENRSLRQTVRRNIDSFPDDFMFTLTNNEANELITRGVSQSVIPPGYNTGGAEMFAFTEHGVAMLATVHKIEQVFEKLEEKAITPKQGIFFDGQIYDAYEFVCGLIKGAKTRIVLIDNYVDDSVLTMLDKRETGVLATVYTQKISPQFQLDINKHNAQYSAIEVKEFTKSHDRFLILDNQVYLIGAITLWTEVLRDPFLT